MSLRTILAKEGLLSGSLSIDGVIRMRSYLNQLVKAGGTLEARDIETDFSGRTRASGIRLGFLVEVPGTYLTVQITEKGREFLKKSR